MAFIRTLHLEIKLATRNIPPDFPEIILTRSRRRFRNSLKDREIFLESLHYHGKIRPMALIVERRGEDFLLVTIFPVSEREIVNRIKNKRWKPL